MSVTTTQSGGIQLSGVPGAKRQLERLQSQYARGLRDGMTDASEWLLERAKELCPVDTGALRDSGHVVSEGTDAQPNVYVEFDTPYAVYVHEDPDAFHEVGQYKFLEQPAREYRVHLMYLVRRRLA